jgi:predicted ferric reductase
MNNQLKKFLGWTVLLAIALIPVILLFALGPEAGEFSDYSSITHTLGEIFGLVGMTLFALTFVLSTRIRFIEDIFGGLDKVYVVHGILGGTALMLILFHPILLVLKFIPSNLHLAATYLLPSSYWSVNLGIIALLGLIFLISITLFSKIKYNKWKFSHEFLGLIFIFAVFHIFLVRGTASKDNIFSGYYIYAAIVSLIGLGAFSYSLFLKNRLIKNAVYRIKVIEKKNDLFIIDMLPEHKPLSYKSGQFIYVRFYNERLSKEAHPFSIASKSNSEKLRIIVKKLGDYTDRLEHLKEGDKILIEGPYGRFNCNLEKKNEEQVWIAGGIGITPFLGMFEDLLNCQVKVDLYHSAKNESDFVNYKELSEANSKIKSFRFIPWNSTEKGYLSAKDISHISGNLLEKTFYICGPEGFKHGIIKGLINAGVNKNKIHEEAFGFR